MNKRTNIFHQNRPGLALGLLVLFVILTALCPAKRLLLTSHSLPVLHQKAKVLPGRSSTDTPETIRSIAGGMCQLSFAQLKESINSKPNAEIKLNYLTAFVFASLLFFRASRFQKGQIPVKVVYHTPSTPIFISNQIFLI